MVFTKAPKANLAGVAPEPFLSLNKDSIMVYGCTIKRSGDGQDKR